MTKHKKRCEYVVEPDTRDRLRKLEFERAEAVRYAQFLEVELSHRNAIIENHKFYFALYQAAIQAEAK
jgi:hypothetical protein